MFPIRLVFAAGTFAAMVAAADAQFGQPGGKGGMPPVSPVPPMTVIFPYLGDGNFHKELKLSEEQVTRLLAFRQKLWDEAYTTAAIDLNTKERDKAIEAGFRAVLDAAQLKRLTELAAQRPLSTSIGLGAEARGMGPTPSDLRRVSSSAVAQCPELAAALKLGDTQKQIVENSSRRGKFGFGGSFGNLYLTPDQTAAAKAFLGEPLKNYLQTRSDPRLRADYFDDSPPEHLSFLRAPDVQKELKLTEAQVQAATQLEAKFRELPAYRPRPPNVSPADAKKASDEPRKAHAALRAETEAALAKLLSPEQRKRLAQIQHQMEGVSEFYEKGELGKVLGVTPDQRKAQVAVAEDHAAAVIKAVASGDPLEKVQAAVKAANRARADAIEKILTAEQHAKKKEWLGEPFRGDPWPPRPGGPGGGFRNLTTDLQKAWFGKYYSELAMLQSDGVRQELKLTEEKVKKLTEAQAALREEFPTQDQAAALQGADKGEKFMADRSKFIEKAIGDILDKNQQARFRELLVQQAEVPGAGRRGAIGTRTTAAAVPGVAEAIKLTEEQKKKLLDGTPAADVLTGEQKTAIKGMMGKEVDVAVVFAAPPLPGNRGGGPGVGGGGGFPNAVGGRPPRLPRSAMLLYESTRYWDALGVSSEQTAKLAAAFNDYTLANSEDRPDPQQLAAVIGAVTKEVETTLGPAKLKRLEQLDLQGRAADSLATVLVGPNRKGGGPGVGPGVGRIGSTRIEELAITVAQEQAIRAAETEFLAIAQLLNRVEYPSGQMGKEVEAAAMKLRVRLDAKIEGILTAEQMAKWRDMLGPLHPGIKKSPLGRGGYGWPGGVLGADAGGVDG